MVGQVGSADQGPHLRARHLGRSLVTPGLTGPDGKVRVLEGGTTRATAVTTDGRGYVRLNHLARGTHHFVLRYWGSGPQVRAFLRFDVRIG